MHEGPTENRLGELGSLYKYYYYYYYYNFFDGVLWGKCFADTCEIPRAYPQLKPAAVFPFLLITSFSYPVYSYAS